MDGQLTKVQKLGHEEDVTNDGLEGASMQNSKGAVPDDGHVEVRRGDARPQCRSQRIETKCSNQRLVVEKELSQEYRSGRSVLRRATSP